MAWFLEPKASEEQEESRAYEVREADRLESIAQTEGKSSWSGARTAETLAIPWQWVPWLVIFQSCAGVGKRPRRLHRLEGVCVLSQVQLGSCKKYWDAKRDRAGEQRHLLALLTVKGYCREGGSCVSQKA